MSINFPLLLVIAVAVCGALALFDLIFLAPRRRAAISTYHGQVSEPDEAVVERLNKEPLLVEYGKSFFPVLAIVLVFRYPSDPNINYIKRVVGLAGDRIAYSSDKRLTINGEPVAQQLIGDEPGSLGSAKLYNEKLGEAEHQIRKEMQRYRVEPGREWVAPQGHYFMLGNNRDNSNASRYWNNPAIPKPLLGMVPDQNIVGKAFAIWMSWPDPKSRNLPNFSRVGLIH